MRKPVGDLNKILLSAIPISLINDYMIWFNQRKYKEQEKAGGNRLQRIKIPTFVSVSHNRCMFNSQKSFFQLSLLGPPLYVLCKSQKTKNFYKNISRISSKTNKLKCNTWDNDFLLCLWAGLELSPNVWLLAKYGDGDNPK